MSAEDCEKRLAQLERQCGDTDQKLERLTVVVNDNAKRVRALERRDGPSRPPLKHK